MFQKKENGTVRIDPIGTLRGIPIVDRCIGPTKLIRKCMSPLDLRLLDATLLYLKRNLSLLTAQPGGRNFCIASSRD